MENESRKQSTELSDFSSKCLRRQLKSRSGLAKTIEQSPWKTDLLAKEKGLRLIRRDQIVKQEKELKLLEMRIKAVPHKFSK